MTESLYCMTLQYLREHPNLINFKELNHQTTKDLFKIIKDKNYLSIVLTCRLVHNWSAIHSYLVKYNITSKHFMYRIITKEKPNPFSQEKLDVFALKVLIGKTYINDIYSSNDGKFIHNKLLDIRYEFTNYDGTDKFHYIICDEIKQIIVGNIYNMAHVYDDELFKKLPKDLVEWAVTNGHLSQPFNIKRKFLTKK